MTASRTLERGVDAAAWLAARGGPADVAGLVVRGAGAVAAAAAAAGGAVLAARRLAGAIDPAAAGPLLAAAAGGVALVLAADAARRAGGSLAAPLAARLGLVLAVAALTLPPRADGAAAWPAVAAAVVATLGAVARTPRTRRRDVASAPRAVEEPAARRRRPPRRRTARGPQPGVLRQRFERRELPAGAERVRGRVVVAVPAGAKAGYGHLGFCPAFAVTPTVDVSTAYDGVEATVTAAEVLPWGVRVECRLAEPAEEPLEIPVDLVAFAGGDAP